MFSSRLRVIDASCTSILMAAMILKCLNEVLLTILAEIPKHNNIDGYRNKLCNLTHINKQNIRNTRKFTFLKFSNSCLTSGKLSPIKGCMVVGSRF